MVPGGASPPMVTSIGPDGIAAATSAISATNSSAQNTIEGATRRSASPISSCESRKLMVAMMIPLRWAAAFSSPNSMLLRLNTAMRPWRFTPAAAIADTNRTARSRNCAWVTLRSPCRYATTSGKRTALSVTTSPSVMSSTAAIDLPAAQQHRYGHRSPAHTHSPDRGRAGSLPIAALAPQLNACFVQEAHAMQATAGELPTAGVDRQRSVQCDMRTVPEEFADLAAPAEAYRFQPHHRQEGETVVELAHIDVGGSQRGVLPQCRCRVVGGHRGDVGSLIPRGPLEHAGPDGFHRQWVSRQAVGGVTAGHDHGGGTVAGHVAVVEAQRLGDHPRAEIVVHRHRFAIDRVRVESGIGARVDRDAAQMLTGQAEVVH